MSRFGNVVNRAFLVLIFWVNKLVGANFTRFCNYALEFLGTFPPDKMIIVYILYSLGVVGQAVLARSVGSIYCLQPTVCELN